MFLYIFEYANILNNLTNKIKIKMKNNIYRDFTKPRLTENLNPWQVTGLVDGEGGFNCIALF
jgi:hypothetical protein